MRRRVIEIIITEDWHPQTEEPPYDIGPCSAVGYKIKHKGEQYGSYLTISRAFLSDDEVIEVASVLIPTALETIRDLEAADENSN